MAEMRLEEDREATDLLRELRGRGAQLRVAEGRLRVSAPTGVIDAAAQAAIRQHRDALLALLAAEADAGAGEEAVSSGAPAPRLSPAQASLWLFQQRHPTSPAYNMSHAVRLVGPVDVERLERAIAAVVERHEPLRSTVDDSDPAGLLAVGPVPERVLDYLDVRDRPAGEGGDPAAAEILRSQTTPFDLTAEAPFRALLVRYGPEEHQLVTTIHHIALDGMSFRHFYRDLTTFYAGRTPPPLRTTYREYARWINGYWTPERVEERSRFWREELAGAPPVLELPTDRTRGDARTFQGAVEVASIPAEHVEALRQLGREEGASLFALMLGVFAGALYRHSGQRDIVIGSPLHGRDRPQDADIIGMFVNQLPLRVRLGSGHTLRDLVREARGTSMRVLTEHELPFGRIVQAVGSELDSTRSPVFQTLLNVLPRMDVETGLESDGVTFELPDMHEAMALFDGQSRFDMTLYVMQRAEGLHLVLVYSEDLFEARTAALVLGTIRRIIAAAASPDRSLDECFPPARRGIGAGSAATAQGDTIVQVVRALAAQRPDAPAIAAGSHSLTYAQLVSGAEGVARNLASHLGGDERPVGVMVPHDVTIATAILGVMMAGRSYVPLDPEYPTDRLRLMAADAGLSAILAGAGLRARAEEIASSETSVIDLNERGNDAGALPPSLAASDVAYLLYTSGSTGRPKAVAQTHGNLLEQAARYARILELTPGDRVALLASISFDASLMDLFGGLSSGACVQVIDPRSTDLSRFPAMVEEQRITTLHFTPTVFRSIAAATEGADWSSVRAVVLGGEPVRPDHIASFDRNFPEEAKLLNLYGASEHSFSIGSFIDRKHRSLEVPVGVPMGDVEIRLVDGDGQEDPVRGEMVIRSAHNALGYRGADPTALAVFRHDEEDPSRSFYRTGDLARRTPDGQYVVLGRVDAQVKVRGHRVEPAEIEAVLRGLPVVTDAGVHAPVGADGERVLTACYTLQNGGVVSVRELAAWCAEQLPRYLVPTEWIEVARLPRTPSGKVDRRALPAPSGRSETNGELELRTPEEEAVARIWTAVLGRDSIGRDDDFFMLGGHSLRAVEVVSRAREIFGVGLSLRTFFERSTVAGLAAWIAENRDATESHPPLRRLDAQEPPLSFAQERVWLFQQLEPDAATYNVTPVMHVDGPLNIDRLRAALRTVVERHEPLRSLILPAAGGVRHRLQSVPDELLPVRDLSQLGESDAVAQLRHIVREENGRPFRLDREPPFRCLLVRLAADRHDLVVTLHHLATDFSSTGIFFEELKSAYHGRELRPLPVTYGDYAEWERACWSGDRLEREVGFWREYLAEAPPTLDFPTDRPRRRGGDREGGLVARAFDAATTRRLFGAAREAGASPFMLLLTAFGAALYRHTGQRDIVVGAPVSGRGRDELAGLMGMFINQLPVRLRIDRDDTFASLLDTARSSARTALSHQDTPFPRLVEALVPEADRSRPPIFQVLLNVLPPRAATPTNTDSPRFREPELEEMRSLLELHSKFDFTLYALDDGGRLQLGFVYDAALFEAARMDRLVDDIERALLRGVEVPDTRVDDLWDESAAKTPDGAADPAPARSVIDAFMRSLAAGPQHAALLDDDGTITYADLQTRARRIAACVAEASVSEHTSPVGIAVPHGSGAVAALLGVLGAGVPYVPLDPAYPEERLRFMLHDAGVRVVLTTEALRDRVAALGSELRVLTLEQAAAGPERDLVRPEPDTVAYLLYTSGSTGRPKAVVQTHGNLLEQASRYARELHFARADRLAWLASLSFDASLMDVFGGLVSGATIAPIDARAVDLARLPELIADRRITVLHVTPTVFRTLSRVTVERFDSLRAVVLGGEAVRPEEVAFFDERFPADAILYNLYGASEHSFSIGGTVDRASRSSEVPIGRPVGDVEILLLDAEGREETIQGEMHLRSRHNALRYWNSPELSERAFRPDPSRPGTLLYRTGDVVRRRPDGAIVFVRRADQQMKVRGHRVEAYEVESALRAHPAVSEVAVHAPLAAEGEATLTACVAPPQRVTAQELSAWCAERLPSFMVPTAWVFLDRLPRTPSGKIDRLGLPVGAPIEDIASSGQARDADEAELHQIWSEVLGASVGVDDDFFAAGGHSLSATQVVARIRDVMGLELPLRYFFDHPTIAETAEWVRENRGTSPALPPLTPRVQGDRAPLSFSQERLWFLQQMDAGASAYNMATAALLEGPLELDRLKRAMETVAQRQESLRTRIVLDRGRAMQVVAPAPVHSFEVEDLSGHAAESRLEAARALVQAHLGAPYDLENGPLCRVVVVRLGEDRYLLGLGTHHTISDMWSYGVLARELRLAYEGVSREPPPVSYRDYALWQREWLQGDALARQVEYWRGQLDGVQALDMATDLPRPAFVSFVGAVLRAELPAELRERLSRFAIANKATPFMTLLAAFNALLSAYAKSEDIAVGVPIAGRRATETQDLVGTFVNTLVHRNDLSGDPSFRDLVGRVRATSLDAYAHQDAPFELLVKELQPPRDTSRAPFFQVLFNVANMAVDGAGLTGVRQRHIPLAREASQFDFSVNVGLNDAMSEVQLTYNTALFSPETAERLLAHYLEILERAVAEPDLPLSRLREPARTDRRLLLEEWNATARPYPASTENLLTLVEVSAKARPDATAVDSPTGSFSYAELVDYARGVTAELRRVGVRPGDRVAIVMSRSREMVGALLGILGAGAAYVPVDANYPAARVSYMLEDSGAAAIVSHRGLERPYHPQVPVVRLDEGPPAARAEFATVASSDAAYVIYTSGSTGKPKGVEISHGAMANFLLSMQEEPGFTEHDRLLAVTTISFDIAVLELYLPLISGGRIVVASEEEALDGRRLMRLIDDAGITMMQATPATWKLMIAAGWTASPRLRVLCGGEPLPRQLADDLLDRTAELWNMYGPTETTVWSTVERIERGGQILVGRPIANTTVYVLRDDLTLCPVGVPGELYIGGAGVANGYVNRPDLTAERFIPDPFRPGERIYRTGDLVRFRPDGRIEHLGRLDNQVKVRGFRIELGEVEAALQSHDAVRDAVVVAADDRLVGYVVLDPAAYATVTELRSWVSNSLPPYMVPALVMTLDELPLTPNGKVDRKRLPAPTGMAAEPRGVVLPSNPAERTVAEVWASLLGIEEVGAGDNFFELGGHSLLAMEAVALIEERTGYRPEPRSLFFMTLGEIAASIPAPALEA